MKKSATLTITNTPASGAAFGVVHYDGASCYIPPHITYEQEFAPGDVVEVTMVKNPPTVDAREKTPYVAISATKITDDTALDDALIEAVDMRMESGKPITAEAMGRDFPRQTVAEITSALEQLFVEERCGKIGRWLPGAKEPETIWYCAYPENVYPEVQT